MKSPLNTLSKTADEPGVSTGSDATRLGFRAAVLTAAANDGGSSHPSWYHNLKATPAARVEIMGRTLAVRAEDMSTDEAAAFWPRLLRRAPSYERYQRATSRAFPLVRLVLDRSLGSPDRRL